MTDPAKALLDATIALLPSQVEQPLPSVMKKDLSALGTGPTCPRCANRQLATITQADLRVLVDTLRDCVDFIAAHTDSESQDRAGRLLARCDNVLDAHDYDANEGERFALKEPRDEDQRLDDPRHGQGR